MFYGYLWSKDIDHGGFQLFFCISLDFPWLFLWDNNPFLQVVGINPGQSRPPSFRFWCISLLSPFFCPRSYPKFTWWVWVPDIVWHYNKSCFHLFSWISASRSFFHPPLSTSSHFDPLPHPLGPKRPRGRIKECMSKATWAMPSTLCGLCGAAMCGLVARSMWGGLCGWPMWLRLLRPMIATLLLFLGCSSNTAHPILSTIILHAHYPPLTQLSPCQYILCK